MKHRNLLIKIAFGIVIAFLLLSLIAPAIFPQSGAPRQEKLLNGLKLLMFPDRNSEKVVLKVRIHAGSAFDPQGKEGLMKLLAANLFPNPETKEFFAEDLGGNLNVHSNYDYIQVEASAKPDQLLALLETVSTAVSNPPIDKENTAKLKSAQLARLTELARDPAHLADRLAAERLLGTFPYGRPEDGSPLSVSKLDFADLLEAKQRFLSADNATVVITGKFDANLAFRAVRRFFGSWLKSDKLVPSTFRQPDDPPGAAMVIDSPDPQRFEIRLVTRGTARASTDAAAMSILARILETRLRTMAPIGHADDPKVRNLEHVLPGTFSLAISGRKDASVPKLDSDELIKRLFAAPISEAEFQGARSAFLVDHDKVDVIDRWLDMDTYKLAAPDRQKERAMAATLADVRRALEQIQKQPFASVVVSSANTAN